MPTPLTDADKVIRNDTGLAIAAAIEALAAPEADRVSYDNTSSGLTADNAQDAIDELKTKNDTKMDKNNPTGTGALSIGRKAETTTGSYSVALGRNTEASGDYGSFASGYQTKASGEGAHSEGNGTEASGNYTHAEGYQTIASSLGAHAEGRSTEASGTCSHAEGRETKASINQAHAEGYQTEATGNSSHSENYGAKASGAYSHAEGLYTEANHRSQHVFGEYNAADQSTATSTNKGNYIEIVGKGTSDTNRSNARTLDWNGNETLAGGLKLHENQDASTLNVSSSIAAGATYDFTNYSDGTVIFVYRLADAGQSDYTGIYIRATNWQRLIPIKEAPNVTTSGYILTNGNSQALRCAILST